MCHMSHVIFHMSLKTTVTVQKPLKEQKTKNVLRYANISNTLFDQMAPVHLEAGFPQWQAHIDRHTTQRHHNLQAELSQRADSVKRG